MSEVVNPGRGYTLCQWPAYEEVRGQNSFSVGIVVVGTTGAIYRVKARPRDMAQVELLAFRLIDWLETRDPSERSPCEIPFSNDRSARILVTPEGKKQGFLAP